MVDRSGEKGQGEDSTPRGILLQCVLVELVLFHTEETDILVAVIVLSAKVRDIYRTSVFVHYLQ